MQTIGERARLHNFGYRTNEMLDGNIGYWRIELVDGTVGWAAEAGMSAYFMEALP